MTEAQPGSPMLHLAGCLVRGWRFLLAIPLLCTSAAVGVSYLVPPTFTARTTIMPQQQASAGIAAALSSLGGLGQLVGAASGGSLRNPADQHIGLMQSATVADRLIDKHGLMAVYGERFRIDARRELDRRTRFAAGKRDGFVTIEVDDEDPARAARLANDYVAALRWLTATLTVSEAQQRRVFFEQQLQAARDALTKAQRALQRSGFDQGTLRAEPKAMADAYARLRAELTATEVRLQTLRTQLTDGSPEVVRAQAQVAALRSKVHLLGSTVQATPGSGGSKEDYIGLYREFKYQETLFELFSRQYEVARVDESREGPLVQIIDEASPPERRSRPKRSIVALVSFGLSLLLTAAFVASVELSRSRPARVGGHAGAGNSGILP